MRLLLITLFLAPACTGFLARVRDHFEKKFKKPECHLEWEDVTTPHCETSHEQVCEEEYKNQCKTEYNTSCQTEYITQCETEYEELCETTERHVRPCLLAAPTQSTRRKFYLDLARIFLRLRLSLRTRFFLHLALMIA